jgi:hypothetical protein
MVDKYVDDLSKAIQELEVQVEKLKCCGNCKHWNIEDAMDGYCDNPSVVEIVPYWENVVKKRADKCDKWEAAK